MYTFDMGQCVCKAKGRGKVDPAVVQDFIRQVRPLDLIVFRGGDLVSAGLIGLQRRKLGRGEISHVEVAMSAEWCAEVNGPEMHSWGSTMSGPLNDGVPNSVGGSTFGVQMRSLSALIESYLANPRADIGLCRLIDNPTVRRADESDEQYAARAEQLRAKIQKCYDDYNNCTYNARPLVLLGALFPSFRPARDIAAKVFSTNRWLFCSEFVAVLYEAVGVIVPAPHYDDLPPVGDVVPQDFLGCDEDPDGIVMPICQIPPNWIKPAASD